MIRAILVLISTAILTIAAHAVERREVRIAMPDGVELAADLYLPASDGAFPAVLIRTPYNKSGNRTFAEKLAAGGYAVVVQDVRGKFASGGTFIPFVHEEKDGLATLDWMAKAVWSNGRIGAFGTSYSGFTALLLARHGHPALTTVFSASGWIGTDKINSPGGALQMMVAIPWLLFTQGQTQRSLGDYDLDSMFRHLPLRDAFDAARVDMPAWKDTRVLRAHDAADYSKVSIPVFHMTGWYDFTVPASLDVWRSMRRATTRPQRLLVGPWVHGQIHLKETAVGDLDAGPDSIVGPEGLTRLATEWFECHLRDRCTAAPPVRIFVLGENRWRDFTEWPPRASRKEMLFLASEGNAAAGDDGHLVAAPRKRAGRDEFVFDPADPVPTVGGANFHFFPEVNGPREQRAVEARPDVAVYTSAPLASDLVLAGPVRAVLHVATEGRDTDFTARLADVAPDGRSIGIVDGIVRLSYRSGSGKRALVEPGRAYEIAVEMGEIAIRVPRGHRLRLAISSSNFPKFDRNPNTGEDPFEAKALKAVRQTIHHSAARPSRVELTVLRDPGEAPRAESSHAAAGGEAKVSLPPAEASLATGRELLDSNKVDEAIDVLERVATREPNRAEAHYWLGRALAEKLQSGGAADKMLLAPKTRRAFERAVQLDPASVEARTSLARYYLSAPMIAGGSVRKAREQADAIVALDPARGHRLLARIHNERKEWSEAAAAYARAAEHAPKDAELHYELGLVYQELQRWPEAMRSFEAAVALKPGLALAWYQLGRTGALSGLEPARALEAIDVYVERFLGTASVTFQTGAWWRKGMLLEKLGRTGEAIAAYRRASELDPAHEPSRAALARLAPK